MFRYTPTVDVSLFIFLWSILRDLNAEDNVRKRLFLLKKEPPLTLWLAETHDKGKVFLGNKQEIFKNKKNI